MQTHTDNTTAMTADAVAANAAEKGPSLGDFLKKTRLAKKGPTGRPMSISDITRRSGLSLPVLSKLEAGKIINPRFTTMIEVSRGYDLPFEALVDFFTNKADSQSAGAN